MEVRGKSVQIRGKPLNQFLDFLSQMVFCFVLGVFVFLGVLGVFGVLGTFMSLGVR